MTDDDLTRAAERVVHHYDGGPDVPMLSWQDIDALRAALAARSEPRAEGPSEAAFNELREAFVTMGENATPPAEGLDVERLARAIRTAETRSQMEAEQLGAMPAEPGPLPDWYRAYAADVAREYAALAPEQPE